MLRNVRVLAIGQEIENKDGEKVATGKTATLELTPRQAELLALAQSMGEISLSLRSLADATPGQAESTAKIGDANSELGEVPEIRRAVARLRRQLRRRNKQDQNRRRQLDASLLLHRAWPRALLSPLGLAACRRDRAGMASADQQHRSYLRVGETAQRAARQITLGLNKSMIVELPREVREVMVSNPEQIDAVLQTSTRAYLIGKAAGEANIIFIDKDGRQVVTLSRSPSSAT